MQDLLFLKERLSQMADLALSMLKNTFDGFMKHDLDTLSGVLKDEHRLNDMERQLTFSLVELSKGKISKTDKKIIALLTNIVADLEQIGDYTKDIIERIEIKIQEKLLFSEEALSEYRHLYSVIEKALSDTLRALKKSDEGSLRQLVRNKENVDKLIEKYRDAHVERLISGICDPRAGNMFLNLLDFTGQIFHHTKSIVKNISRLK